jgi:hypothetical protein
MLQTCLLSLMMVGSDKEKDDRGPSHLAHGPTGGLEQELFLPQQSSSQAQDSGQPPLLSWASWGI